MSLTSNNFRFFERAKYLAQFGEHRVRVGCLATYRGTPLVGSFNTIRNETTAGVSYRHLTRHAEYNVVSQLPPLDMRRVSIYVARIDKNGDLKPSFPCRHCLDTLIETGVKDIIYWDGVVQKMNHKEMLSWEK